MASAGDGRDTRWERASLECCPPNLVRFLASMPGYVYAQDARGGIYVNLYVSGGARFTIGDREIAIAVDSEMPWGGTSKLTIAAKQAVTGAIRLRIPGWARGVPAPGALYSYEDRTPGPIRVSVNGIAGDARPDQLGYVTLDRSWQNGDVVEAVSVCDPESHYDGRVKRRAAKSQSGGDHSRIAPSGRIGDAARLGMLTPRPG